MDLSTLTGDRFMRRLEQNRGRLDPFELPRWLDRIRKDAAEFAAREVAPRALALDRAPTSAEPDADLVRAAGRAGMLTMAIPRLFGGDTGLTTMFRHGGLPIAIVLEELACACAGVATLVGAHQLGLLPLVFSGDLGAWLRILPGVARAARREHPQLCAFAITEPDAGSDVEDTVGSRTARLGCHAERVAGGYRLRGRKCFISNGSAAEWVFVFAALDRSVGVRSWTCLAVRKGTPGFSVGRIEHKMGHRASPAAELVFDDVFVPTAFRVGAERQGWRLNRLVLDVSRAGVGAIGLGIARGALECAIVACRERNLLERPDVRQELAGLVMKVEMLRSLVWRACMTFPPHGWLSASAKAQSGDVAVDVCGRAMALIGDAALVEDVGLEKRLRDARLIQIYEGTNQVNRVLVAEECVPVL